MSFRPFSWEEMKKKAVEIKVRRARTMAKLPVDNSGTISRHSIAHPEEVKEYQNTQKFVLVDNRIRKEVKKRQDIAMQRRNKLVGKI